MKCNDYSCNHMQSNGYCALSACIRFHDRVISNNINTVLENDYMIFPQTIGSITFYTKKELIDWVCIQQDSNYGIGNGA